MGEVNGVDTYRTYDASYGYGSNDATPAAETGAAQGSASNFQQDVQSGIENTKAVVGAAENPDWLPVIVREVRSGWTGDTVFAIWGQYFPLSIFVSLLFIIGIIYCTYRILNIRRMEWAAFRRAAHTVEAEDIPRTQLRWHRVLEHANSTDEHKWRLAILEGDIMLNELLDLQGYKGETIAEKLKQVSKTNFNSVDDAWEAHKMRNRVAHEGADLHISEREKNHVINLYQRVFQEFGFI